MAKAKWGRRLAESLKGILVENADLAKYWGDLPKEVQNELANGTQSSISKFELLNRRLVDLAITNPAKYQWAVQLIFDRTEGRAAQSATDPEDSSRDFDSKLSRIGKQHLQTFVPTSVIRNAQDSDEAKVVAPGPASAILDLPDDRSGGPEASG